MRIVVLNERDPLHPQAGGAEIHVQEVFHRLVARGHDVTHLATSFPGCKSVERIEGIKVRRLGRIPVYYPSVVAACARGTRNGEFDVVVECLNKIPFYAPVYSKAPVLALCHHLFGEIAFQQVSWPIAAAVWSMERLIPSIYRNCSFITISESSRQDLIARGLSGDQILVSHCGLNRPASDPNVEQVRAPSVIYLGRIEAYKNVDVMLRAMAKLAERFPDVPILVVGKGGAQPSLEQLARELGLADRTRFTGFVSIEERDALLAESRVCVCPSSKEGWGLTVVEANALGTPVVATDAPGLRDSVRDGETGFLVPEGDVDCFAGRIGELLADDLLAQRQSRAALAWSKHFDWDLAANDMAESLEKLL